MKPTTTPAQIAANRANAAASTGPVTPEGKQASKYNRLSHGLASAMTVLPFENQAEYDALYAAFLAEHAPVGPTEEALVKLITDSQWKLRRLERLEEQVFASMLAGADCAAPQNEANSSPYVAIAATMLGPGNHHAVLNSLARYQSALTRQFVQSLKELRHCREDRAKAEAEAFERRCFQQLSGDAERSQKAMSEWNMYRRNPEALIACLDREADTLLANARKERERRALGDSCNSVA